MIYMLPWFSFGHDPIMRMMMYCRGGHHCETASLLLGLKVYLRWVLGGREEWFSFFAIFENGHIAMDWLYFYEFNLKKSANFDACARGARARQSFHFQKITGTLKLNIFLIVQKSSFLHQEQLWKIKFKIRICSDFYFIFQKWQKGFDLKNSFKNIFFGSISPFLAFK